MENKIIIQAFRPTVVFLAIFTILFGLIYPGVVTLILQTAFPNKANGSLIYHRQQIIGSVLLGQAFSDPKYFWGRLSETSSYPYNAASSSGSNLGVANPLLLAKVNARLQLLTTSYPSNKTPVPIDLVTSSGSGLDPHISIQAAFYQAPRVAKNRNLDEQDVLALINQATELRQFGLLGEARVNVLKLNLILDENQINGT